MSSYNKRRYSRRNSGYNKRRRYSNTGSYYAAKPVPVVVANNMVEDADANPQNSTICKIPGIVIPDKTLTKLKFTARVDMGAAAGAVTSRIFSGNSIFDPTRAGGTNPTQPNGYDQWAQFYTNWVVTGSKFKVKLIPTSTTGTPATSSMEAVVCPLPQATYTASTMLALRQQKYACWSVFGAGMDPPFCQAYNSTAKIFGRSKDSISSDTSFQGSAATSGTTGTDPSVQWIWVLQTATVDGSSTVPCIAFVEIVYYCSYLNRRTIVDA